MKILAIETASDACSAALLIDNEIIDYFQIAPREHGRLILSMVDGLLNEADIKLQQLDALAFGRGPGSFTGVRMATGVIQGLAFATDLPVAPISTLAALAQQERNKASEKVVYAALDARMGEVYWCEYIVVNDVLTSMCDEVVAAPGKIQVEQGRSAFGIGSGWKTYANELTQLVQANELVVLPDALPRAKEVAQLAVNAVNNEQTVKAENALPVYLRDNVAKKKTQQ